MPRLPPVVVVFADHLKNVADTETDTGLHARNQVIIAWIVVE